MATRAEGRMNLAALQQRDPYITDIVDTASQVALYSFNSVTNEWVSIDIVLEMNVESRQRQLIQKPVSPRVARSMYQSMSSLCVLRSPSAMMFMSVNHDISH